MALPIAPVTMPSDLAGRSNGQLPESLLSPTVGGGRLHHLAARAWRALCDAAWREAEMPLTFIYGGTYRTYAAQETLFRSRYSPDGQHGGCKTWNGQRWCKKLVNGRVPATAAVPGTSNHGWGLAVDAAWDKDLTDGLGPDDAAYIESHPGWQWLLANAHRFGWSWELQSEPWHIRYVAGDDIPGEVLAFENLTPGPQPEPEPTPDPEPQEPTEMLFIAKPTFSGATASDPWLVYYVNPGSGSRVERATNAHVRAATILNVPVVDQDSQEQYLNTLSTYNIPR